ncbi:hypothetical protein ACFFKU_02560 [Kineococcus gynurae]|uniref:Trypsin-like peptidase n=1 Tax=Kineococcus gynurae TaxID=452979 RepID=A0ABV5LSK7_9ACTN
MHIDSARELKAQLRAGALDEIRSQGLRGGAGAPAGSYGSVPGGVASVGISVLGRGSEGPRYGLAVRYSGARGDVLAERARALTSTAAGAELDVRDVGRIRALSFPTGSTPTGGPGGGTGTDTRWAATTLQQRTRPLHPGLSIAQEDVTAGTLGAFVRVEGSDGVYILSNNHVIADSDRASVDDPILQPGPADGGQAADRVARLARAIPLAAGDGNTVDAAIALLADGEEFDPTYPVGRITGFTDPEDEVDVEKVGRTTGWTTGRISAIELDDVAVEYPVGVVSFDGQFEVTGHDRAFSAGGDSGSLVYLPGSGQAVGLLFAGSERGGDNGTGLTFCNPIGLVLSALGATLVG